MGGILSTGAPSPHQSMQLVARSALLPTPGHYASVTVTAPQCPTGASNQFFGVRGGHLRRLVGEDGSGEAGVAVWGLPGGGGGWQASWEGQVITITIISTLRYFNIL